MSIEFQESIVSGMGFGVIVIDRNSNIQIWNLRSENLWGLRSEEVLGQSFFNLDVGLPVEDLNTAVRFILAGKSAREETVLDAVNRRGKPIRCRITCSPLFGIEKQVEGVILLMQQEEKYEPGEEHKGEAQA